MVIISTALTAYGTAVSYPFVESMMANSIDDSERAKTMSILYVILFGITAPFGYIGGTLSSISEELPFVLTTILFVICLVLVVVLDRLDRSKVVSTDNTVQM
jgi:DHA1 family tetracycline resistance protein-like MFS transporter